ncbi:hypothetical protein ANMWB30_38190 [Arthrobacter sp. MWB30]|nr:hypothetical protein ANMWB30_38190 [Arthrobacter sp. MWB30]
MAREFARHPAAIAPRFGTDVSKTDNLHPTSLMVDAGSPMATRLANVICGKRCSGSEGGAGCSSKYAA